MGELALSNVINVSVSQAQTGLGRFNTSNLAIFSREAANMSFGTDGYKIYLSPTEVGEDFGTGSETYKQALKVFSQKPNILAGGGYLVVIAFADTADVTEVQLVEFSAVPTSGSYKLKYGANETAAIAFGDNAAAVQAALQLVAGLGAVTVTGDTTVGFSVTFTGISGPATLLLVTENSLQAAGPVNVETTVSVTTPGTVLSTEDLDAAISRSLDLVQYFGLMCSEIVSQADMLAAAAVVQALNKIAFFVSKTPADVDPGGMLDLLRSTGYTQSRGLYYANDDDSEALQMMAAYASRALSTNFEGNNTTQTMHLKDLTGVEADSSMTQALLQKCLDAGVDTYVSIQGVAKVFCSGENTFFDRVYNLQAFVGDIQVAGFNALARTSTKVPQTENGVRVLKGAYRKICEQYNTNQYIAGGEWNSPDSFGNQDDFFDNIRQRGYYIYSAPLSEQSQASREAREAPLVQIAIKEAGAMHSSDVIINVNA